MTGCLLSLPGLILNIISSASEAKKMKEEKEILEYDKSPLKADNSILSQNNTVELCSFFGIVISMKYDNNASPCFNVNYSNYDAIFGINDLLIIKGEIPSRVFDLVIEWAKIHKNELLENWNMLEETGKYFEIKPLC